MKKVLTKRAAALLAAFGMMIWIAASVMPAMPVMAAGTLSAEATASTGSIESGSSPAIQVVFTQSDWTSDVPTSISIKANGNGGLSNNDTSKLSVSGRSITLNARTLTYSATISAGAFTYDGTHNAGITFDVDYKNGETVLESTSAVATVATTKDPVDDDTGGDTPTPPVIAGNIFSIGENARVPSIDAGKGAVISYPVTSGSKRISGDVQITAKLPDKVYFNTASSTQTFTFSRERTHDVELDISADSSLESGTYPVTLTVSYKYGGAAREETIETYLKVNGKTPEEEGAGQLSVVNYSVNPASVNAGRNFKVSLTVQNTGTADFENIQVALGGLATEGFTMNGTVDSQRISSLKAGASTTLSFSLCSSEKMASGNYNLDVTMTSGESSYTSKIFVPVVGNPAVDDEDAPKTESTPQLMIESYSYGEGVTAVTGGEVFTLSAVIRNTGKTAVRNVKLTISSTMDEQTGGAFSPANSSNTFYIDSIPAGGSVTETIDLLPKADASPKSYGVDFAFSYEAIVNDELVTKEVTQTVAIPLIQPDRFEVTDIQMYGPVMFGESLNGYVSYVNKGKSTIFNLSMKVAGDGFTTAETETYIGNVESGSSDGYDLTLNPTQAGPLSGTVTFTYEDANGDTKEIVKEFQTEVMEYVEPEIPDDMLDPDMPVEAEGGMPVWGWAAIAAGGVVVLIVVIVVVRKVVKKKKQAAMDAEDDYDDEGEQQ